MKKLQWGLFLILTLPLILWSCEKDDNFIPEVSVSAEHLPFACESASTPQIIAITSNADWTAASDKTWCKLSPDSGKGNGSISVTVEDNPEVNERSAKITISAKGMEPVIIDVLQVGLNPILTLGQHTYDVESTTSVLEIAVTNNLSDVTYAISENAASWIHFKAMTQTSAVVKTFSFEVDDNLGAFRQAAITFSGERVNDVQAQVKQKAWVSGFGVINPASGKALVMSDATEISFEVKSNVDFKISNKTGWLNFVSKTQQGDKYTLKYSLNPNSTSGVRYDSVVFVRTADDLRLGAIKVDQWVQGESFASDSLALMALYKSTDGANWSDITKWNITQPMRKFSTTTQKYTWNTTAYFGITYNNTINRVTKVSLSNRLNGQLPQEIGLLTELTELTIAGNATYKLVGTIPEEVCNLTKLTTFSLRANELTGSIPDKIGNLSLVVNFRLDNNNLTGSIPKSIGNLVTASSIVLASNQLSGAVPEEVGLLSAKLSLLDLRDNQLTSIPASIGNCASLTSLHVEYNKLTGSIPSSITKLSKLQQLYLMENNFTGGIPSDIGSLTELSELYLTENPNLGGTIPASLCNLTKLILLNLQNCNLSGTIPANIGNLKKIAAFTVRKNPSLGGDIPASMAEMTVTSMNYFLLDSCSFTGTIDVLKGLKFIGTVSLNHNNFTGTIPVEFESKSLAVFDVEYNQLTGSIPNFGNTVALLNKLTWLGLGHNKLSGTIPENILARFTGDFAHRLFCPQEGDGFSNFPCDTCE